MPAHTQAHANMPPEPIIQANYQQIHVTETIREKGAQEEKQQKENWKFLVCKEGKKYLLKLSDAHKSTKAHRAEEGDKNGWNITCK